MIGLNKMQIIGNVGMKPEVKYSSSGTAIVNLSVATTETWVDKNTGEKKQDTEWHKVVMYGKIAEIAGQYCDKGSKVYVEGKLKTRSYEDKEGIKRYTTEVVISGYQGIFQMLDKKDDSHVVVSPVVTNDAVDNPPF
jgi:single-strand DNA-binding protein